MAAQLVPYAFSGLLLSGLADAARPRTVLVACDALQGLLVAAMTISHAPVAVLLVLVFVQGLVPPIFGGARQATLADLLPTDVYPLARSLLRLVTQSSQLIGYAAAGILVQLLGARLVLGLDSGTFFVSAATLFLVTGDVPKRVAATTSMLKQSAEGLRIVLRSRPLRGWIGVNSLSASATATLDAFMVPYVAMRHGSASSVGLLFATYGAGSVVGEVLASRLRPAWRMRLVGPGLVLGPIGVCTLFTGPPLWSSGWCWSSAGSPTRVGPASTPGSWPRRPPSPAGVSGCWRAAAT